MYRALCNCCGQSAVHSTDEKAWDDIYHIGGCEAADVDLPEAETLGQAEVEIAVAEPVAA